MESKIGRISKVFTFKRIQMNGDVIHNKAYGNVVRRNSCIVFVDDAGFLEVKFYVKVYVQCQMFYFALMNALARFQFIMELLIAS